MRNLSFDIEKRGFSFNNAKYLFVKLKVGFGCLPLRHNFTLNNTKSRVNCHEYRSQTVLNENNSTIVLEISLGVLST